MIDPPDSGCLSWSRLSALTKMALAMVVLGFLSPFLVTAQNPLVPANLIQDTVPAGTAPGGPTDAEILFRFPVGGVVTTGPVVGGTMIWFISDSRTLYVLDSSGRAIEIGRAHV